MFHIPYNEAYHMIYCTNFTWQIDVGYCLCDWILEYDCHNKIVKLTSINAENATQLLGPKYLLN